MAADGIGPITRFSYPISPRCQRFGGALQACQRIRRAALQGSTEQPLDRKSPPAWRESEVSAVLDATPAVDRAHADVLTHADAQREFGAKFEVVGRGIDTLDVEANPKAQAERATAHQHDLPRLCRTAGFDRLDPRIGPGVVVAGSVRRRQTASGGAATVSAGQT
jgi:hypothetical protein